MVPGELELRLVIGDEGRPVAELRDAVAVPEKLGTLEPPRWVERRAKEATAFEELSDHLGPVRISVPITHARDQSLIAIADFGRELRPDALFVLRGPTGVAKPGPALALPLRCAGLSGRSGPRFDSFTEQAAKQGLLSLEETRPGRQPPPHVLQLPADVDFEEIARALASSRQVPLLVVVEGWSGGEPMAWLRQVELLAGAGCGAILALTTTGEVSPLMRGVEKIYRALAHDRAIDEIARELMGAGVIVTLALSDGAEHALSLRRAVLNQPRRRRVLPTHGAPTTSRAPTSELEVLLADRAVYAKARLAEIAREVKALRFDPELSSAVELVRADQEIEDILDEDGFALNWDLALLESPLTRRRPDYFEGFPGSPMATGVAMPPRTLRATMYRDDAELSDGMIVAERLRLDVAIDFAYEGGIRAVIPVEVLEYAFGDAGTIPIDFVVWAPPSEVEIICESATVLLPRLGVTPPVHFDVRMKPLPDGVDEAIRRLRVTAYHRNCLLQSLAIDVAVGRSLRPQRPPSQAFDYALSEELVAADAGPERRLSIFLNEGPDGTHWLGARTKDDKSPHAAPIALGSQSSFVAESVHKALRAASALGDGDRYALPLSAITADDLASRKDHLVKLAKAGCEMFTHVFATADSGEKIRAVAVALRSPDGHIEVARCRSDAPSLPWQLVYDFPLDFDTATLCSSYLDQLEKGQDLLDRPDECSRQSVCPHRTTFAGQIADLSGYATVCPFGFWGSRHRIAQPIALRRDTSTPAQAPPSGDPGVTVGYFEFENASDHIAHVAPSRGSPHRIATSSKAEFAQYLRERRDAMVYLYCHGKKLDTSFVLQLGSDNDANAQYIRANDLKNWVQPLWTHAPIVVLNGCDTLQVSPSTLNDLFGVLRNLGAAAVIGPEIAMFTSSAAKIGEAIVSGIFEGLPLDEVMVKIRRALMREMSPMGLAYNVYAPSGLAWSLREPAGSQNRSREGSGKLFR